MNVANMCTAYDVSHSSCTATVAHNLHSQSCSCSLCHGAGTLKSRHEQHGCLLSCVRSGLCSRHDYSLLELQVPLPRGTTALQWLQGQKAAPAQRLLQPQVYFSPRQSSAPGTAGAAAAEAASAGAGAVAGAHSHVSQLCFV